VLGPQECFRHLVHEAEKLMLRPARLSKRKNALLQILRDGFGLRGKCIPVKDEEGANQKHQFASHASIEVLGQFILCKLEEDATSDK